MIVKSVAKYQRISPKKMRQVAGLVKNKNAVTAELQLKLTNKKAAALISKVLRTAINDAEHNHNLKKESLIVKNVIIDQGPSFARFMPRARGSASPIKKRTSHIQVLVEGTEFMAGAPKKVKAPVDISWEEIEKEAKNAKAKEPVEATADAKVNDKPSSESEEKTEVIEKEEALQYEAKPHAIDSLNKGGQNFMKKFFRRKSGNG